MVVAEYTAPSFEGFLVQRLGFVESAQARVRARQVVQGGQRRWVLVAEVAAVALDRAKQQRLGLCKAPLLEVKRAEVTQTMVGSGVLLSEDTNVNLEGSSENGLGLLELLIIFRFPDAELSMLTLAYSTSASRGAAPHDMPASKPIISTVRTEHITRLLLTYPALEGRGYTPPSLLVSGSALVELWE